MILAGASSRVRLTRLQEISAFFAMPCCEIMQGNSARRISRMLKKAVQQGRSDRPFP